MKAERERDSIMNMEKFMKRTRYFTWEKVDEGGFSVENRNDGDEQVLCTVLLLTNKNGQFGDIIFLYHGLLTNYAQEFQINSSEVKLLNCSNAKFLDFEKMSNCLIRAL